MALQSLFVESVFNPLLLESAFSPVPALVEAEADSLLEETSGVWQYLLVFVLTMVPAIEPFIVIPVAIGLGLDPVVTGLVAFAGSITIVSVIVLAQHRLLAWWSQRTANEGEDSSGRYARARRIWERYGLVGLSFAGPILAGIHLTAMLAVSAGSSRKTTIGWLTVGLGAWTLALVAASLAGVSLLGMT
ncbi:small multi-drug export protein [Natronolimnobius sp. AArcel1]|uniref:small multi-drug export protein n=1 Tax=Natronolimnobius sp. AArcel1 TaxID=1679093 RepID=UPI0013EAE364|nr:small multi-drug export protein [Natronolimnobius sp. AArcel1]NGM67403.1 small multi-drug export protein [Natronolimnobius sp. AArcel1]